MTQQPYWAKACSISRIHDHTQTHRTQYHSNGRVISLTHRPLTDDTQHSQKTDFHVPCRTGIHNPRKRDVAGARLRPRCHCERRN